MGGITHAVYLCQACILDAHNSWPSYMQFQTVSTSAASSSDRKTLEMLHKLGRGMLGRPQQAILKVHGFWPVESSYSRLGASH